jgi:subtilisin family serine protease
MRHSRIAHLGFVLLFLVAGCMDGDHPTAPTQPDDALGAISDGRGSDIIEGHYIVVLSKQPAAQSASAEAALESVTAALSRRGGASVNRTYRHTLTGFAAELTDEQFEELRRDPRVLAIEQDSYVYLTNDGIVQEYPTWGLDRIDQREPLLDRAYAYTAMGQGVTAYIMDSGIRYSHEEFGGRASLGYDFVLDDDPDNTDPNQEPGDDCRGHGTHVAGTVGGTTYGVAKHVSLVSVRVFGCGAGSPRSRVLAAIEWITANAAHPAVVNMSLGGYSNELSESSEIAIENSIEAGIHYVTSAGNSNEDACLWFPALLSGVLTVGAVDIGGGRASFSNYGDCVDLFAPGVSIISAFITDDWSGDGSYTRSWGGTSMASPHVTGVVALYLEPNPAASPAEVHAAILANSTPDAVTDVPSGTNSLLHSLWSSFGFTPPPLPELNLSTTGLKVQGKHAIDLAWDSPSGGSRVQVFRDESLIAQGWGYGSYRDQTGERGNDASYVHQVCQRHEEEHYQLRENCSEKVTTIFGSGGDDGGTDPPPGEGPAASFDYSCDNSPTCQFTDNSTGQIDEWRWTSTSGHSSVEQHPHFTFSGAGSHTVTLKVTDGAVSSDEASTVINCKENPRHGLRCS